MNYFDLHCDTPYECYLRDEPFYKNGLSVSGEKGKGFDKWKQLFAVWIRDDIDEPFRLYRKIIDGFKKKLKDKPENLISYFAVEGGAVIEDDKDRLYILKEDGICSLALTWNGANRLAGGCKTDVGLTHLGRQVIEKMNSLHICCDLSHLNDKSFYKAVELSDYPIATHSNCRAVCDVPRNLTDEQLEMIAEKGGLIGLCFYPEFLGGNAFGGIYENIKHMLKLGLEDNMAIGSDFDGAKMSEELSDITKLPNLYLYLNKKGISNIILDKIFYENAKNYFETFDKAK